MLTVLVTTRNRARRLGSTIDALERLDTPRGGWRLLVVDDGSDDATPVLLAALSSRFAPETFDIVRTPPIGQNAARNRALDVVRGDLVVFTDDDTRPRSDWLVRLRNAADAHPEVDVLAGTVLPRFEVEPPAHVLRAVRKGPSFAWVEREVEGPIDPTEAVGPSFAVRTSRLAGGFRFDETIGPDGTADYAMGSETEMLLRLGRAGAKAWYVKEAIVEHVVTAAQADPGALVLRAYRYGRGRWRLRTSRLARARLRVRGLPLSILADLLSRRIAYALARKRGDDEAEFRAAWRIAYLAGHVVEIRRERGRAPGLGAVGVLVPRGVRRMLPATNGRSADGVTASGGAARVQGGRA